MASQSAKALRGEPVGLVLGGESGQERHADRGVDLGEQTDRAGEDVAQVGSKLVGDGDSVADQIFAGTAGAAQRDGVVGVGVSRRSRARSVRRVSAST